MVFVHESFMRVRVLVIHLVQSFACWGRISKQRCRVRFANRSTRPGSARCPSCWTLVMVSIRKLVAGIKKKTLLSRFLVGKNSKCQGWSICPFRRTRSYPMFGGFISSLLILVHQIRFKTINKASHETQPYAIPIFLGWSGYRCYSCVLIHNPQGTS